MVLKSTVSVRSNQENINCAILISRHNVLPKDMTTVKRILHVCVHCALNPALLPCMTLCHGRHLLSICACTLQEIDPAMTDQDEIPNEDLDQNSS